MNEISLKRALGRGRLMAMAGVGAGILLSATGAAAQETGLAYYESKVLPLLQEHCLKCHGGGERIKAGLNLTWRTGLIEGGDQGSAVDLDAPEKSLLLDMMSYRDEDHQMPPSGKLDDAELAIFAEWIRMGLPMPDERPEKAVEVHASPYNNKINDETRNWWSYRPVAKPAPPVVNDAAWSGPIDAFIKAKLDEAGLAPAPEAERRTLIRRATYDLTGLPPTPAEVDAFVADPDPAAYENLLDRLWHRHTMARNGAGTGWTSCAMPRRMAMNATTPSPISGVTATM